MYNSFAYCDIFSNFGKKYKLISTTHMQTYIIT
jgi:hypothetical protein